MVTLVGKSISQSGLGLMRMTSHEGPMAEEDAFKVLKSAINEGVTLWNGADFYGTPTYNSLHLMAQYFEKYPEDADKVVLCIKSGVVDMKTFSIDGSPDTARRLVDNANSILGPYKKIDIFGIARVDPQVPVEDTMKTLATLVAEGKIGGIQLSEVGASTIRRAAAVADIAMVEEEVSLWATEILTNGVAEVCAELKIPIVAHTPLGAGMLTGQVKTVADLPSQYLRFFPRFQGENFQKNLDLVAELQKLAASKNVSPAQLALSWIKLQSRKPGVPFLIPIAGARSVARVKENAMTVELSEDDFEAIKVILDSFPSSGDRFPAPGMKLVEF